MQIIHTLRQTDNHTSTHQFTTTPPPQPFYGPFFPGPPGTAGARIELLDFMVQRKTNRGRHIDYPAGCHSIRTNQCPPPPSPHFFKGRMSFLPPNQQCQSNDGNPVNLPQVKTKTTHNTANTVQSKETNAAVPWETLCTTLESHHHWTACWHGDLPAAPASACYSVYPSVQVLVRRTITALLDSHRRVLDTAADINTQQPQTYVSSTILITTDCHSTLVLALESQHKCRNNFLLAATLRWFTAGGAIRMALRQLSQTWKLRHYAFIDDILTRKL